MTFHWERSETTQSASDTTNSARAIENAGAAAYDPKQIVKHADLQIAQNTPDWLPHVTPADWNTPPRNMTRNQRYEWERMTPRERDDYNRLSPGEQWTRDRLNTREKYDYDRMTPNERWDYDHRR